MFSKDHLCSISQLIGQEVRQTALQIMHMHDKSCEEIMSHFVESQMGKLVDDLAECLSDQEDQEDSRIWGMSKCKR